MLCTTEEKHIQFSPNFSEISIFHIVGCISGESNTIPHNHKQRRSWQNENVLLSIMTDLIVYNNQLNQNEIVVSQ